jgi:hypothetical protein
VNNNPPFVFQRPGNVMTRLARRMILEARNHVERENPYYWSFQLAMRVRRNALQSRNAAEKSLN